jgi:TonB-dependent starch-binding outer membrane protein SusC
MPKLTCLTRVLLLVCMLLSIQFSSYSQQKTVSGKITSSADGAAVAGATVTVKGANISVASGADGVFTINVPAEKTVLVITAVGFDGQEISIQGHAAVDVALKGSANTLNEVVVTGYSSQRKKDITGSVSVVNTKEMVANPGSNVESMLQGRAAGVTVGTSGVPGAGAAVRIRGYSTFNSNEPLYIVDGARVGSIVDLNPNDIESMQVLKDGSSAAVYGAAAANGVIVITTKRGKGKPKVNYDFYYGFQQLTRKYDLLNTAEYGEYLLKLQKGIPGQTATKFNLGQYNGGLDSTDTPVIPEYILAGNKSGVQAGDPAADPSLYKLDLNDVNGAGTYLIVPANKQGTDWLGEVSQVAPIQSHSLSISGGTETGNYLLGLNYYSQDGIIKYTGYDRYSIRANTSFTVKNVLRIGENLQISYIDKHGFTNQDEGNSISMAYRMQPIVPVFDIAGNYAGTRGSNLGNASNPYANLERAYPNKDRKVGVLGSVYAEIDFLKYFTFRSVAGIDWGSSYWYYFNVPQYENAEGRGGIGQYGEGHNNGYNFNWYNTVSFHKMFGDKHDVRALVGTEMVENSSRGVDGNSTNYFSFDRNFWQISSGLATGQSANSYEYRLRKYSPLIAKVDYTFADKYLFSASFRRDGNSNTFGPNHRYGNFPSASFGWRISEENFMAGKIKWLDDLKLRVGYGKLGNDNTNDFGFITTYAFDAWSASYPVDGSNTSFQAGFRQKMVGNPNVKWEESTTLNVGFDASMFGNKLNIALDLYDKKTTDLLYDKQLDPTIYGLPDRQPTNIGDMDNKGIDLAATYRFTIARDWNFDAGLTFSKYNNKVVRIADPFFEGDRSRIDPFNRSAAGHEMSSFYGYVIDGFFTSQAEMDAIDQPQEGIGKWKYKDLSGPNGKPDGKITSDDRTWIGSPHPDFTMGFNLGVTYKNFDFASFIYLKAGGQIANYVRYWSDFNTFQGNRDRRVLYDSWTPDHQNAKLPILDGSDGYSGQQPSTYFIEPGGYLRMKNLAIGYRLPASILRRAGIDRIRLYVQAQNLFTITKYTGLDPELSTKDVGRGDYRPNKTDARNLGVDYGNFPTPRVWTFGANVTF